METVITAWEKEFQIVQVGSRMEDQSRAERNGQEQVSHRGSCKEGHSGANVRQTLFSETSSFFWNILEEGDSQVEKWEWCQGEVNTDFVLCF